MKKLGWIVFIFFAVLIGIYPLFYFLAKENMSNGLLATKPAALLESGLWNWAFYQHIIPGGVALLTGWSQFSPKIRSKRLRLHRNLGRIYVTACLLSGIGGLYLAIHATGGPVAQFGFGMLAVSWLYTTTKAYTAVRNRAIEAHRAWMIRSYALSFAAVTLRLWLPAFAISGISFMEAYLIISWLCWVPNLLFAEWWIRRGTLQVAEKVSTDMLDADS